MASLGSPPLALSRPSRPLLPISSQGAKEFRFLYTTTHLLYRASPAPHVTGRRRRKILCAGNSDTEKAFQSTVELDKFIDELREAEDRKLPELVAKNLFSFDTTFWMRLATRAELCSSSDDKKDYEELARSIMTIVERVVRKTQDKIESSTDILKSILKPIIIPDEEILWPPRDPNGIMYMKQELQRKEQEGYLDESFLSEVNAQMRQAKEDGDKPGLVAILQKVLQLYASHILSARSYAIKDGQVDKVEEFLEGVISADEENWGPLLRTGLVYGGGQIEPEDLYKTINKRVERIIMRTESGSYKQRVVVEYLKEIEERTRAQVEAFQAPAA